MLRWVAGSIYPHLQNQQILIDNIEACLINYAVYHMSMRLFHQTNTENLKKPIRVFSGLVIVAKGNVTWFKWKYIFKEIICVALLDSLKTKNQCLRYFSSVAIHLLLKNRNPLVSRKTLILTHLQFTSHTNHDENLTILDFIFFEKNVDLS
jgi:hypothetical protein